MQVLTRKLLNIYRTSGRATPTVLVARETSLMPEWVAPWQITTGYKSSGMLSINLAHSVRVKTSITR